MPAAQIFDQRNHLIGPRRVIQRFVEVTGIAVITQIDARSCKTFAPETTAGGKHVG